MNIKLLTSNGTRLLWFKRLKGLPFDYKIYVNEDIRENTFKSGAWKNGN